MSALVAIAVSADLAPFVECPGWVFNEWGAVERCDDCPVYADDDAARAAAHASPRFYERRAALMRRRRLNESDS